MPEQQPQLEDSGQKVPEFTEKRPQKKTRKWYHRVSRMLFIYVIVPYLVLFTLMAIFQRKLIYHRNQIAALSLQAERSAGVSVQDIQVPTEDDLIINGWHYLPTSQKTSSDKIAEHESLVLFFPGNAGNRESRFTLPHDLAHANCHVMICDYRGYADNPGSPSEQALCADAEALWKFAIEEKEANPAHIILYGESIGGGVATHLASFACQNETPPAGLVLSGTFSSMADTAAVLYPYFPVRLALLDQYHSAEKISHVTCPVTQIHGTLDQIVPLEIGKKLFDATPDKSSSGIEKQFVVLKDAGHNDISISVIANAIRNFAHQAPKGEWKTFQDLLKRSAQQK